MKEPHGNNVQKIESAFLQVLGTREQQYNEKREQVIFGEEGNIKVPEQQRC